MSEFKEISPKFSFVGRTLILLIATVLGWGIVIGLFYITAPTVVNVAQQIQDSYEIKHH